MSEPPYPNDSLILRGICIIVVIAVAIICMYWLLFDDPKALGQALNPPLGVQFSRTYLSQDSLLVLWSPTGTTTYEPLPKTVTLRDGEGRSYSLERSWFRRPSEHESAYWQAVKLSVPAGVYEVMHNSTILGNITVNTKVKPKPVRRYAPGVMASTINSYLPNWTVELLPGYHYFDQPIHMPPGSELRGYGAIVAGGTTLYQNALVRLSDNCTVRGIHFKPNNAAFTGSYQGAEAHLENNASNCNVIDCNFTGGMFGIFTQPGIWVDNCSFDCSTVTHISSGVWKHCEFKGIGTHEHGFKVLNAKNLALIESSFRGTDRGPILIGETQRCLFAGVQCFDINRIPNGCEICCIEGGGKVNDNLFFGWRTNNCPGAFQPFNTEFKRNLIYEFKFDKTWIIFWGDGDQSDNIIRDCELQGGGITFNVPGSIGAQRNKLERVACLDFRLTSQNQPSGDPIYYNRSDWPNLSVIGDYSGRSASNAMKAITIRGQGERRDLFNMTLAP